MIRKMNTREQNKRVYLDWAAATPVSVAALQAMQSYFAESFGNPSSIHKEGQISRLAVETAREQVARAVQVRPEFVTFTGGGTEGNNMVILGAIDFLFSQGRAYNSMEIITTHIEHPSIIKAVEHLKILGVGIRYVQVDKDGRIELTHLKEIISEKTVMVSCAYANSEIGTVQAVHGVRKVIREAEGKFSSNILFHLDAAQAPLWLSCQFDAVGVDFLVLDAAKCCGPKGVGILIRSHRAKINQVIFGGGQEQGLRSGTENVPGIVGSGVALMEAQSSWRERAESVSKIRDEGIKMLLTKIPNAVLNGAQGENRLANNINISIPGLDTEYAAVMLDSKGFAVSTKSACAGAGVGESLVVKTISSDPARATSTLRFSLGVDTTIEDLERLTEVLVEHIQTMEKFSLK